MSLRIRRGTNAERQGITFDLGEIVWTSDTEQLWVGDGITQGGVNPAASLAGVNLVFNPTTNQLDVSNLTTDGVAQGQNNKYFSAELAQAAAASLFQTGTHTGITFVYDDSQNKINATVTVTGGGNFNLLDDTTPELGGDLVLNSNDITGTGNIDIIGGIEATGTLLVAGGLGGDLTLNSHDIIGTGNINTIGTFWASQGLGGNLTLNNYDIVGTGNINTTGLLSIGTILATTGLGGTLYLNSYNIEGTGDIDTNGDLNITGDATISGTITSTLGLGGNLILNGNNITGTGNIDITGNFYNESITIDNNNVVSSTKLVLKGFGDPSVQVLGLANSEGGAWFEISGIGGSFEAPTSLSAGNPVSGYRLTAYNGTAFKGVSAVWAELVATANLSSDFPASNVNFAVGNNTAPVLFQFTNTGNFVAPNCITPGVHADATARDAAIPTPIAGMMVFNTALQKFQGYVSDTGLAAGGAPTSTPGWINLN